VRLHGHAPAKCVVQQDVLGYRRQPLVAPEDVRNSHQVVVDDVGQMIGGIAVRLEQHEIVQLGVVHHDVPANEVVKLGLATKRHRQPDHRSDALCLALGDLSTRQKPAMPVVSGEALGLLFEAHGLEALRRAEAAIREPLIYQSLRILLVNGQAV